MRCRDFQVQPVGATPSVLDLQVVKRLIAAPLLVGGRDGLLALRARAQVARQPAPSHLFAAIDAVAAGLGSVGHRFVSLFWTAAGIRRWMTRCLRAISLAFLRHYTTTVPNCADGPIWAWAAGRKSQRISNNECRKRNGNPSPSAIRVRIYCDYSLPSPKACSPQP